MLLYHFVPDDMSGDTLYPLNQLKDINPVLFEKHKLKYAHLKEKDVPIPGFGNWNDCVNLMPVNPGVVKKELEKYGHDTRWTWKFFEIDSRTLVPSDLVLMVPMDAKDFSQRRFLPFNQQNCDTYCRITDITRHRYQQAKEKGEQPFTFSGITHVLYRGAINVASAKQVTF